MGRDEREGGVSKLVSGEDPMAPWRLVLVRVWCGVSGVTPEVIWWWYAAYVGGRGFGAG